MVRERHSRTEEMRMPRLHGRMILFTALICAGVLWSCGKDRDFKRAVGKFRADGLDKIDRSAKTLPFFTVKTLDPVWNTAGRKIIRIPEYRFTNQYKRSVTEEKMDGRITVACFFYTHCPGYCPNIMRNMRRIQSALKNDPRFYMISHSVTPDLDHPARLMEYGTNLGVARRNWDLVTGDRRALYHLARETYNADTRVAKPGSPLARGLGKRDFIHSEHIYIIDSRRRVRGIYNGNYNTNVARVVRDVRLLMKSEGPSKQVELSGR